MVHERIALICSAPIDNLNAIAQKLTDFPYLVAVDGGLNHCLDMGIIPDEAIGDFDSASRAALQKFQSIPQKHFPEEKDHTDLELAITSIDHPQLKEIVVFGALQGRTDHTLSNLMLLTRLKGKLFFETDKERLFAIATTVKLHTYIGQVISLIPLNGPVKNVRTKGLKWELNNATLNREFISISNEAVSTNVDISIGEGDLVCCVNKLP